MESICREGYGPGGVAVIVTARPGATPDEAALRELFRSHGGRLGAVGSVAYLFRPVGLLRYAPDARLPARAVEAGAEDVLATADGSVEVLTDPAERDEVERRLERQGHRAQRKAAHWRATDRVRIAPLERVRLEQLERHLAALPGVAHVYTNVQTSDQLLAPV